MNFFNFLLTSDSVITGAQGGKAVVQKAAEAATTGAGTSVAPSGGLFGVGPVQGIIFYCIVLFAIFYFGSIRPQKKRQKELKNMQESVKVGDSVMTTSGFYGKIVDLGEDVFVVEFGTNKGVRVPVRKTDIVSNKEPKFNSKESKES